MTMFRFLPLFQKAHQALRIDVPRWAVSMVRRDAGRRLAAQRSMARRCGAARGVLALGGAARKAIAERDGGKGGA